MNAIPRLETSLTGPLLAIEQAFLDRQHDIEHWFHQQWQHIPPPFYTSVDIRNAGFKVAPVDTNLFPAGFNNLHSDSDLLCLPALESAVLRYCPTANSVLVIAENHTRNQFYLDSLARLSDLISRSGFKVRIGQIGIDQPVDHVLPNGSGLTIYPVEWDEYLYAGEGFSPCAILLNNDLSSGAPSILEGLADSEGQHVIPPVDLGWHQRTKLENFMAYEAVTQKFSHEMGIDPWILSPLYTDREIMLDFDSETSIEALQDEASQLLHRIKHKYQEHNVDHDPFIMMKSNRGTYGMGVLSITDAAQLEALNRKQRNKMKVGKEGVKIDNVVLQEGVFSFETIGQDKSVAEPVVYMIDHYVVGGFYRIHSRKGVNENLNSPGAKFKPLAMQSPLMSPDQEGKPDDEVNRFYAYGVIARLAMAAAAQEIDGAVSRKTG